MKMQCHLGFAKRVVHVSVVFFPQTRGVDASDGFFCLNMNTDFIGKPQSKLANASFDAAVQISLPVSNQIQGRLANSTLDIQSCEHESSKLKITLTHAAFDLEVHGHSIV